MDYYSIKTKKTPQKVRTLYTAGKGLPCDNITCLTYGKDGMLFAGTEKGLAYFNGSEFSLIEGVSEKVTALYYSKNDILYVGTVNSVYNVINLAVNKKQDFADSVVDIACDGNGDVWLATVSTCYKLFEGTFNRFQSFDFENTHCMTAFGDREVFAACDKALLVLHGKRPRWSTLMPDMCNVPKAIRTLASDSLGYVWVGTDEGVYLYDGKSEWITPKDFDFFPKCPINKIVFGSDGTFYFATEIGAYVINGSKTRFLGKGRYLASERACDIVVKDDNSEYWIATDRGLSRIELKMMSLSEKAEYYESKMPYFNREDYYTGALVSDISVPLEESTNEISDNDGLWSALYLGALCFKYKKTGDTAAKEQASKTMKALLKLQNMTGISGFPARAYRRPGEHAFGNGHHEWHLVHDEKGALEWKGETSSDELVGHYFGAAYYSDMIADEDEKKEIAESIKRITDHLIENGYTLCDTDGLPTTWAHFGPQELNDEELWCWEKGINSLELVAFMRITEHLTGDKKYGDIADGLIKKHHYGMNLLMYKRYDSYANHIDDLLGILSIMPLLEYEKNADMRRYLLLALRRHYNYEKIEHYPLFAFASALYSGGHANFDDCIETLEDYPLDLFDYKTDHTIRPDIEINHGPEEFGDRPQALHALPADERVLGVLSYEAFCIKGGYDTRFIEPSEWLLNYWMGVYYGMIEE
ncbi:MAG: hypothetical protein E7573_00105 [Ruminococcaceae bacterium]|nr:hypothetical protein [Oscillospiraceae bacterium]